MTNLIVIELGSAMDESDDESNPGQQTPHAGGLPEEAGQTGNLPNNSDSPNPAKFYLFEALNNLKLVVSWLILSETELSDRLPSVRLVESSAVSLSHLSASVVLVSEVTKCQMSEVSVPAVSQTGSNRTILYAKL